MFQAISHLNDFTAVEESALPKQTKETQTQNIQYKSQKYLS